MTEKEQMLEKVQTPVRTPSIAGDLVVPLGQALISGALLAGLVVFVVFELAPDAKVNRWSVWFGLALAVAAGAWVWLLKDSRDSLWQVEKYLNMDLDNDKKIGNPKRTIDIDVKTDGGKRHRILGADDLGIDDEHLILFARGLVNGRKLTEGEWNKDNAFPEGRDQFKRVRAKLLEAGLIEAVNPNVQNSTYRLTPAGRAVMRRLANETAAQ